MEAHEATGGTSRRPNPRRARGRHRQTLRAHRRPGRRPAHRARPASRTRSSAATAPGSPPWSAWSRGCTGRTPDRSPSAVSPRPPSGTPPAWQSKVACVYQKSMVVPDLTVAENLFLNRRSRAAGSRGSRWRGLRARARELLAEYGVERRPGRPREAISPWNSGSSWRSPARSPSAPGSSSWTSRPPSSTRAASSGSSTKLRELQATRAWRSCSSPTISRRSTSCAPPVTVYRDARHVLTAPVADLSKA